ncbi:MAG: FxsA family protein [Deltaproteobacteria bacterium]|nr:FxsA family protein [Deltaproteobacteria bacterium]MCB9785970.1 FxsA family protein [Deltaproteobacteria bacterium]
MLKLFVLFTVLPVLELWLLIRMGSVLGAPMTVALCLLSGFVGAALARSQGARAVQRMQETVARGMVPAREILDGVLILVAGVVLLTPGFITDTMGILLLLPPVRAVIRGYISRRFAGRLQAGAWQTTGGGGASWSAWTASRGGPAGPRDRGPFGEGGADQEILPPERAPRHDPRRPPRIIDNDE